MMLFSTVNVCEKGFSTHSIDAENKYRNRLQVKLYLRLRLSNTDPRYTRFGVKETTQ